MAARPSVSASASVSGSAPRSPIDGATRRWRLAIFVFMLVVGVAMASWIVRTPAVRNALDASTAEMGLVLFGLSVGSMTGVLASAALVRRLGGRATMAIGGALLVLGVVIVGGASSVSLAVGVAAGLALIGGGVGLSEIAINIEGAEIERRISRSVLPVLHGCFSLGTVVGALVGMLLTALDVAVGWHLVAVAVVMAAAVLWAIRAMPVGTGRVARAGTDAAVAAARASGARPTTGRSRPVWREPRILLLGLIVLGLALAEGSANDWLPLLMVDGHGMSPTLGSAVFAAFAAAMTIGRFVGAPLVERFGAAAVLRVSALVSAAGIALVVFSPNPVLAGIAVLLWGLGAALGFPVSISAAGESADPARSAASVSAVATAGYLAFLVGPPLLGFVGEHVGLRGAMVIVLVLVAAVSFLAPAARSRRSSVRRGGAAVDAS